MYIEKITAIFFVTLYFPRFPLLCGSTKASHPKFSLREKLRNSSPVEFIKVENINGFKEGLDKVRLGSITVIKHGSNAVQMC